MGSKIKEPVGGHLRAKNSLGLQDLHDLTTREASLQFAHKPMVRSSYASHAFTL